MKWKIFRHAIISGSAATLTLLLMRVAFYEYGIDLNFIIIMLIVFVIVALIVYLKESAKN
ncbi:hypothetical protein [Algimonas porphyrae]|uniref:Uncharacterized protein n=1 Tax=Algimonas porphyrae TaxID=1128113 RepID=A0ABQ5V4Z4_9PROT|nr:hypothetical protein GCM10007854_23070 [Algimonas porphyrae]